jgi:hypothetical protein
MTIKPNTDNIAATLIDGEAIIVNLTTGVYYSTDGIGAEVWGMLEQGKLIVDIADSIAARYEVTKDQASRDLEALVAKLLAEDLVSEVDAGVSEPVAEPRDVNEARAPYVAPVLTIYRDMGDLLALDPPMPGLRDIPLQTGLPPSA